MEKGEMVLMEGHEIHKRATKTTTPIPAKPSNKWCRPQTGWNKLNIDWAFKEEDGTGGTDMILQDNTCAIVFASSRFLPRRSSAMEVETAACAEGISFALEWSAEPFILKTNCAVAANMIRDDGVNRSPVAAKVVEIKALLQSGREHAISHVFRGQNIVAHALSQLIRRINTRTAAWIRHGPDVIRKLCQDDCNTVP
ncbi:hypothetical protein VPH35_095041 [Triticum aestivum]